MVKRFVGGLGLTLSVAAGAGPLPAFAGCVTTGAVTVTQCDGSGVAAWVDSGTGSLTVTDMDVSTALADYGAISLRGALVGAVDISLTVDGSTSVTTTGANGVLARTEDGNITITTGSDLTINSAGKGLVGWVNQNGSIVITNYATINAGQDDAFTNHSSEAGTEGIDGSAHGEGSSVSITNYGAITSTYGRGIYADGGYASSTEVAVTIDNEGKVDAFLAGARAIDYFGTATVINGAGATIVSRNHQAVVAWAANGDAVVRNLGSITADNGPAIVAWGSAAVTVDNYGTVSSAYIPDQPSTSASYYGIEGFSQVAGNVTIDNHAGATVTAGYSDGLYGHGVSGSVDIINAGKVTAADAGIRAETADGSITVDNSGWVGSDGAGGVVVLSGTGLTQVDVENAQGGTIVASTTLATVPTAGNLAGLSTPEQALFATAVTGRAVSIAADAATLSIVNAGTILGNITVAPDAVGDMTGTGSIANSGLWAFSGSSGFASGVDGATIDNTGTVWALGTSALAGDVLNQGVLRVGSLAATPGRLLLSGNYAAGTGSTLAFDLASVGTSAGTPVLEIAGNVTGTTRAVLDDPQSLAGIRWDALPRGTVIKVDGTAALGESSFTMRQSYGLITMGLAYSEGDRSWSLDYSTAPAGRSLARLPRAGRGQLEALFDAGEDRLAQLRNGLWSEPEPETKPYAFAEEPSNPISSALATAKTDAPRYGVWARALGETGNGNGYDRHAGQFASGIDGSFALDTGGRLLLGLAASYGVSRLDFNASGTRATLSGPGITGYAGLAFDNGGFVDLNAGWQGLNTDLDLAGVAASTQGNSFGGKLTAGRRLIGWGLEITPTVAVSASRTEFGSFSMQGLGVDFAGSDAVTAEAGLAVAQPIAMSFGEVRLFGGVTAGGRAVSGDGVTISDTGTYREDADGLFGRASLGVSLTNQAHNAMISLTGGLRRDTGETSGDLRLTGSLAF
ncbi:autotransporter family protein [Labrys monachus]|uniref:Autotransporter domain-containing protein n=1 Tax=Labrys monachus TaxID=217067 RepID=A0ABU0F7N3_9HYPH|nr:autotransporter domain-containing protein [Labrys monachus]MDQ0390627.1 hypothetical protein [Labrys monachus]